MPESRLLVGILVHGLEVDTLEVIRQGDRFLVPLEPFLELSGSRLSTVGEAARLETPLGTVGIPPEYLRTFDDISYLDQRFFEEQLATPMAFDSETFSLRLDLPWRIDRKIVQRAAAEPLTPEFTPPQFSLSIVRTELTLTRESDLERLASSTLLGGLLARGWWRMRYQTDLDGNQRLQEYAWLRPIDDHQLVQVGHQQVQLHPLLGGVEMTGAQFAWTNQSLDLFARSAVPRELIPRQIAPITTFRGPAPPAGLAELWVDDILVARQRIGFSGTYEFLDVLLPGRHSRIEVRVFERHDLVIPAAIYGEALTVSRFLLGEGATIHLAGAGSDGNLLQEEVGLASGEGLAGFYQWRHGVSGRLSVEAAAQRSRENLQVMAGIVARLSPGFVMSFGLGSADGDQLGYHLDLDGQHNAWRFMARSRRLEAGFRSAASDETFDHLLEVGHRRSRRLDFGFIARSRRDSNRRVAFALPALFWQATRRLSLRARPDSEGEYRFDLRQRLSRSAKLAVTVQDQVSTSLSYRFGGHFQSHLLMQLGGAQSDRYAATLSWSAGGRWQPAVNAGPVYAKQEIGFRFSASLAALPGVLAHLSVEDDPLATQGVRFQIGLSADLTLSRGRLLPARGSSVREDRGAVAGRIRIETPIPLPRFDLAGLTIFVDGRPSKQTESGGSYFLGDLEAGVYRVELDIENLPIELVPEQTSFVAEVAAAAVTRIDFVVKPEFGIAGRVTDARGRNLPDTRLEVIDLLSRKLKSVETDRFGLFRIDGLPIGSYTLRVSAESFPDAGFELPSRQIEIRDDFLFGQDLVLPKAAGRDDAG